jgi:hypothetical protein
MGIRELSYSKTESESAPQPGILDWTEAEVGVCRRENQELAWAAPQDITASDILQ